MEAKRQPLGEHVEELRQRLMAISFVVLVGSAIGYIIHPTLFKFLRAPLNQQLYYTSPFGGFNAIIKISVIFGLVVASPVIAYELNQFFKPAYRDRRSPASVRLICLSVVLAAAGVSLAYFVSLPIALHFLTSVDSKDLHPFIIVNDYMNFALGYLASFALLFQIPIIMLIINRVKPLKPRKMMSYQRYVVAGSLILAVLLNPAPNPINLAIMAAPIILLYQLSVFMVFRYNRKHRSDIPTEGSTGKESAVSSPMNSAVIHDIIPSQPTKTSSN